MEFDHLNRAGLSMVANPTDYELAALTAQIDADRAEILADTIKAFREEMAPHYAAYRAAIGVAA